MHLGRLQTPVGQFSKIDMLCRDMNLDLQVEARSNSAESLQFMVNNKNK